MKSFTDRVFRIYLVVRTNGELSGCDAYTDKTMAISVADALGNGYTVTEKLVIRGEIRRGDA